MEALKEEAKVALRVHFSSDDLIKIIISYMCEHCGGCGKQVYTFLYFCYFCYNYQHTWCLSVTCLAFGESHPLPTEKTMATICYRCEREQIESQWQKHKKRLHP